MTKKKKYKKQARKHPPKNGGLAGFGDAVVEKPKDAKGYVLKGAGIVLSGILGAAIGSAVGKHSLLAGIPAIIFGLKLGNPYLLGGGIGSITVAGYNALNPVEEKLNLESAQDRVKNYFKNFSQKLYLPQKSSESSAASSTQTDQTTQGLSGGQSTYFINPFSTGSQSDGFEALNRIESQVEQMSGGLFGDDLPDREM